MPSLNFDLPPRRRSMLLPALAFAVLALGCADESMTVASDDAVAEVDTGSSPAAQEAAPASEEAWPEKCDQVYRLTVDQNGKGPKLKIPAGSEVHPQVILDAPWGDEPVQALAFRPITDNKKVLHHWIAYAMQGGAFITGWAPGQDETEAGKLPEGVGLFLPKGPRAIRLDMHYYNKQGTTEMEDASGVEVCVTKTPRKYAAATFMGFAGIPVLPANQTTNTVGTCKVRVTQPVFLMTTSAHAHELATHMKFTHQRGSQVTVMHDAPFYFEEQTSTALKGGPLELKNGDVITTTCTFKNTTNRTVTFGENTGNEMCFNFASYYPLGALSCALF